MARNNKLIGLQILLILAFLLQPILLPTQPDDIGRSIFSKVILKNFIANVLIVVFFYFNYFFLIPRLYFTKKYISYIIILAFSLFLITYVPSFAVSSLPSQRKKPSLSRIFNDPKPPRSGFEPEQKPRKSKSPIGRFQQFFADNDQTFLWFGSIAFFSLLLRVSNRYYETENAKQEAEINYLLAQINPHFLFNVLNSIYTLTIKEKAPGSSATLLKLSNLLRYIFTETNSKMVPLEKELTCLNDLIELQKLRLTDNVLLSYKVEGDITNKQIASLLLIPFVENAFKHGVSTDETSSIRIRIDVGEENLTMEINNNKIDIKNDHIDNKSGLGIQNVRKRLQLLYPGKHQLDIYETDQSFNVTLKIFF